MSSPGSRTGLTAFASSLILRTLTPCSSATRLRLKSLVMIGQCRLRAILTSLPSTSATPSISTSGNSMGTEESFCRRLSISSPRLPRLRRMVSAREKSRLEEVRDIVFALYAQGNAEKAENDSGDKGEYTPEVRGQV